MTASLAEFGRLRRRASAVLGAALLAGALSAPTFGQDETSTAQPLSLVPPATLDPVEPLPNMPGHSVIRSRTAPETSLETPTKATGVIEVNPLEEIAPDAIGTLDPDSGGLGLEMWRGSQRQVVARLLQRLPEAMNSREMRSLARRLLTSIAAPPEGQFTDADPDGPKLLTLRLERLLAMGEISGTDDLLAAVPPRHDTETMARLRVDAALFAHDYQGACRQVRNGISVYHESVYWQKAMVFCHMVGGEMNQMMLALDLLRERGEVDDAMFDALAAKAFGAQAELPTDSQLSPLHLAMMQVAEVPLPQGSVENAPPPLLAAIAQASKIPLETRAAAAERACAEGVLDGTILARVYASYSFAPNELAGSIGAVETLAGPRLRALHYQAARGESLPATRAEILRAALEHGEEAGLYPALMDLYLPMIAEIPVSPELAWFATTAGRALYAAGRYENASAWLLLGRQEALISPQGSTAAASLWPYSRLAGGGAVTADGSLAAWRAMREGMGEAALDRLQTLLRAAFQALGERDPLSWSWMAADVERFGPPVPNAALLYALEEVSQSRRIGETVLLSLIILGEDGPGASHAYALSSVLAALNRVGLEREARALAIEAALASGV